MKHSSVTAVVLDSDTPVADSAWETLNPKPWAPAGLSLRAGSTGTCGRLSKKENKKKKRHARCAQPVVQLANSIGAFVVSAFVVPDAPV